MEQSIWLGSYPRSGSTWVQFILAELLYNTVDPIKVMALIPDRHKKEKRVGTYKTHRTQPPNDSNNIYVVRHPVDVCVSGINYKKLKRGSVKASRFAKNFIIHRGNPDWLRAGYGSWVEHVKSWHKDNTHVIKYEDLLVNTVGVISLLGQWLCIDEFDSVSAYNKTQFKAMKIAEENSIISKQKSVLYNPKYEGYKNGARFVNRGQSGYAAEILTKVQIKGICEACKEGMEIAGYKGYEGIC